MQHHGLDLVQQLFKASYLALVIWKQPYMIGPFPFPKDIKRIFRSKAVLLPCAWLEPCLLRRKKLNEGVNEACPNYAHVYAMQDKINRWFDEFPLPQLRQWQAALANGSPAHSWKMATKIWKENWWTFIFSATSTLRSLKKGIYARAMQSPIVKSNTAKRFHLAGRMFDNLVGPKRVYKDGPGPRHDEEWRYSYARSQRKGHSRRRCTGGA